MTTYKMGIEHDAENNVNFWERILKFRPEKVFTPNIYLGGCFHCGSNDTAPMNASAWTSKRKCNQCGYFTYVVHADFMGGALNEDVACDKIDAEI